MRCSEPGLSVAVGNRCVPCAGSLSLGRWAALHFPQSPLHEIEIIANTPRSLCFGRGCSRWLRYDHDCQAHGNAWHSSERALSGHACEFRLFRLRLTGVADELRQPNIGGVRVPKDRCRAIGSFGDSSRAQALGACDFGAGYAGTTREQRRWVES